MDKDAFSKILAESGLDPWRQTQLKFAFKLNLTDAQITVIADNRLSFNQADEIINCFIDGMNQDVISNLITENSSVEKIRNERINFLIKKNHDTDLDKFVLKKIMDAQELHQKKIVELLNTHLTLLKDTMSERLSNPSSDDNKDTLTTAYVDEKFTFLISQINDLISSSITYNQTSHEKTAVQKADEKSFLSKVSSPKKLFRRKEIDFIDIVSNTALNDDQILALADAHKKGICAATLKKLASPDFSPEKIRTLSSIALTQKNDEETFIPEE
jgi:hypothetical protein